VTFSGQVAGAGARVVVGLLLGHVGVASSCHSHSGQVSYPSLIDNQSSTLGPELLAYLCSERRAAGSGSSLYAEVHSAQPTRMTSSVTRPKLMTRMLASWGREVVPFFAWYVVDDELERRPTGPAELWTALDCNPFNPTNKPTIHKPLNPCHRVPCHLRPNHYSPNTFVLWRSTFPRRWLISRPH